MAVPFARRIVRRGVNSAAIPICLTRITRLDALVVGIYAQSVATHAVRLQLIHVAGVGQDVERGTPLGSVVFSSPNGHVEHIGVGAALDNLIVGCVGYSYVECADVDVLDGSISVFDVSRRGLVFHPASPVMNI